MLCQAGEKVAMLSVEKKKKEVLFETDSQGHWNQCILTLHIFVSHTLL